MQKLTVVEEKEVKKIVKVRKNFKVPTVSKSRLGAHCLRATNLIDARCVGIKCEECILNTENLVTFLKS